MSLKILSKENLNKKINSPERSKAQLPSIKQKEKIEIGGEPIMIDESTLAKKHPKKKKKGKTIDIESEEIKSTTNKINTETIQTKEIGINPKNRRIIVKLKVNKIVYRIIFKYKSEEKFLSFRPETKIREMKENISKMINLEINQMIVIYNDKEISDNDSDKTLNNFFGDQKLPINLIVKKKYSTDVKSLYYLNQGLSGYDHKVKVINYPSLTSKSVSSYKNIFELVNNFYKQNSINAGFSVDREIIQNNIKKKRENLYIKTENNLVNNSNSNNINIYNEEINEERNEKNKEKNKEESKEENKDLNNKVNKKENKEEDGGKGEEGVEEKRENGGNKGEEIKKEEVKEDGKENELPLLTSQNKKNEYNNIMIYIVGFPSPGLAFDFNRYLSTLKITNPTYKDIKSHLMLSKVNNLSRKKISSTNELTYSHESRYNRSRNLLNNINNAFSYQLDKGTIRSSSPYISTDEQRYLDYKENKSKWLSPKGFIPSVNNRWSGMNL